MFCLVSSVAIFILSHGKKAYKTVYILFFNHFYDANLIHLVFLEK